MMNRLTQQAAIGAVASLICWGQGLYAADLSGEQQLLADRYVRLKAAAMRIAESSEESAETRAKQIRAAISESQTLEIEMRFSRLVDQLERQRLSAATAGQTELARRLEDLLRVMIEDPREAELEETKARLERLAKEIGSLIRKQRSLRLATESGAGRSLLESADRQAQLAEQTKRLATSPDAQQSNPSGGSEQTPISDRIDKARQRMQSAERSLRSEDSEQATEEQLSAQQELEAAQREIEEALNQLREEQLQRKLVGLIDRLRVMHAGESKLREDTLALHAKHTDGSRQRSLQLGVSGLKESQQRIADEADRALRLVRADGASLVFADALEQVARDMDSILRRLDRQRIARGTQALQQGVIDSLSLMIDAVRQSLNDLEQHQQSREQSGGSGMMSSSLIAKLAEMRMLKAVQSRILRQTELWNDLSSAEGQDQSEVDRELLRLAEEQHRIAKAAAHASAQP